MSEQRHNQDLRRIYYVEEATNSRIHHFLPKCIAFNQSALRHFLPEGIAPRITPGCQTVAPSSSFCFTCRRGSEWGNSLTLHTTRKKFTVTVIFFPRKKQNVPKKGQYTKLSMSWSFWPFSNNSRLFQISEGCQKLTKLSEDY